jgi:hypothetical protein
MKQIDIARRLGCSQMQVSRLLRRAMTNLRTLTEEPADLNRLKSGRSRVLAGPQNGNGEGRGQRARI